MRTYGYRRSLAEANEAANRRPENRLIYAQQQVDWFYTDLLKAQHGMVIAPLYSAREAFYVARVLKAERDLQDAHGRLLKVCAELGPGTVEESRLPPDGAWWTFLVRDAAGYIRSRGGAYMTRSSATLIGQDVARHLGLEVE